MDMRTDYEDLFNFNDEFLNEELEKHNSQLNGKKSSLNLVSIKYKISVEKTEINYRLLIF